MTIPKIVLAGGACSGKSTTVRYLQKRLPEMGITPFIVPELATQMFEGGISWLHVRDNYDDAIRFQQYMIEKQLSNEEWYETFATIMPGTRKVLICDRGMLDNVAYVNAEQAEQVMYNIWELYDMTEQEMGERYTGVIHLASLAFLDDYNLDNPARYETPEEARTMCTHIFKTWAAHRGDKYHMHIPASTELKMKMEHAAQHTQQILEANGY